MTPVERMVAAGMSRDCASETEIWYMTQGGMRMVWSPISLPWKRWPGWTKSMRFESYNPNPYGEKRGGLHCPGPVESIGAGLVYDLLWDMCGGGALRGTCPRPTPPGGAYLRRKGFHRELAPEDITVAEFAAGYPQGTYILALSSHVVCVRDGTLYDSWHSENEIVLYYWMKG